MDPLHTFAQRAIHESGGVRSTEEIARDRRETARTNCQRSFWMLTGLGLASAIAGLAGVGYYLSAVAGLVTMDEKLRSGVLIAAVTIGIMGTLFVYLARSFRLPWDLRTRGRPARAVVIASEVGVRVRQGKRGPITATILELRVAVHVEGTSPYETRARAVEEVHGRLVPGQETVVLVDPAKPSRVLVRDALIG
ncbi:MAG: hypothetical protein Q8S73_08650 [Deltaproteobacteria bacterium]|nr:hypothetical protein [Myxococcales bacterium]MDP3214160.1 hypothetical protein [Deltaproteobacteria bacterium]